MSKLAEALIEKLDAAMSAMDKAVARAITKAHPELRPEAIHISTGLMNELREAGELWPSKPERFYGYPVVARRDFPEATWAFQYHGEVPH